MVESNRIRFVPDLCTVFVPVDDSDAVFAVHVVIYFYWPVPGLYF